jgi:hypothetical protein
MAWAFVFAVLVCFLAGTVHAALTDLRPPFRALRTGYPYMYGFTPDRNFPDVRWAAAKAVEVFPAEKRWLKLVIADVAPDAASNPVDVKVWINQKLLLRANRRGNFPIERWVRMPPYGTLVMVQVTANRTWRPADADPREPERGVAIREWSFSDDDPPKGSVTIESPSEYLP